MQNSAEHYDWQRCFIDCCGGPATFQSRAVALGGIESRPPLNCNCGRLHADLAGIRERKLVARCGAAGMGGVRSINLAKKHACPGGVTGITLKPFLQRISGASSAFVGWRGTSRRNAILTAGDRPKARPSSRPGGVRLIWSIEVYGTTCSNKAEFFRPGAPQNGCGLGTIREFVAWPLGASCSRASRSKNLLAGRGYCQGNCCGPR